LEKLVSSPLLASDTYTRYIHGLGSRPNKLNTTQQFSTQGVQHQDSGDRLGVVQAEQSKLETSSSYFHFL